MSRCLACDIIMSSEDLKLDSEFCPDCFGAYLDNLRDLDKEDDEDLFGDDDDK